MGKKRVFTAIVLFSCLGLASCGGSTQDEDETERAAAAMGEFLGDCAHSFNVAAAAQIVYPPTWANTYGAKVSINPDAASGACLITVANFKDRIANQYLQTVSSWTDTPLWPSDLDSSVLNWNAEVVDGGYIHYLDGEQNPDSETEACDSHYVGPDAPVSDIEVLGLSCSEAYDQLDGWTDESSGSFEVQGADGWSCSTEQVAEGQGYTHFECARDEQILRFNF